MGQEAYRCSSNKFIMVSPRKARRVACLHQMAVILCAYASLLIASLKILVALGIHLDRSMRCLHCMLGLDFLIC